MSPARAGNNNKRENDMRRILSLTIVAATLAVAMATSTPLVAQQQPPAEAPKPADPAAIAAAEKLVAAMGAEDQARATIDSLKRALIGHTQATEPAKVVGFTAYADKELAPGSPRVTQYLGEVSRLAVAYYAQRFTVEEMNAIAAFQTSAAGRKFQALTPELGAAIAERTMQFQSDLIRTIQQGAAAKP